jgi:hypothetical protein
LSLFLRKWNKQVIGGDEENDSDDEISDSGQNNGPSIFGLEPGSMPEYFETILLFIICATSISQAVITLEDREPYTQLIDLFNKFQRLIELYKEFFPLFPLGAASCVASACRDMLEVSLLQTQQCVEWRSSQPLIPFSEKKANVFDPASVSNLENFLNDLSSKVIGTVLDLCDFWQRDNSRMLVSKSSYLRLMAEKSARRVKTICFDVNLTAPSFNSSGEVLWIDRRIHDTKGFHELDLSLKNRNIKERAPFQIRNKRKLDDEGQSLLGEDNESAFRVTGGWGRSSNGERAKLSLNALAQRD